MKKVALVFVLAVLGPSLVLAWLALRSLRDQQFLLERQQSLLYQGVADALAAKVDEALGDYQHTFAAKVSALLRDRDQRTVAGSFDELLCKDWPLAEVGFAVTTTGDILCPLPQSRPEARTFCADNGRFLANRETVEVYWNPKSGFNNLQVADPPAQQFFERQTNVATQTATQIVLNATLDLTNAISQQPVVIPLNSLSNDHYQPPILANSLSSANSAGQVPSSAQNSAVFNEGNNSWFRRSAANSRVELRNVMPLQQAETFQNFGTKYKQPPAFPLTPSPPANAPLQPQAQARSDASSRSLPPPSATQTRDDRPQPQPVPVQKPAVSEDNQQQISKVSAAEAEFRQLIGDDNEGTLARFVDNKLRVLFWCRSPRDSQIVFGAQLALPRLAAELQTVLQDIEPALQQEICVALLDDTARPAALSHPGFHALWKHPFVATEIGESLPHWEVALYLLNPAKLSQSAHTLKLTLGLLIAVLVSAIGIGSWLIVADLNRHLALARQKTDFVSNVSHELKTPLTSIRMFSELLAEGRVTDAAKQRSYLGIITAETARLTRLINNVLDFARIDRGEKKYHFQACDLVAAVRETADTYRPNLEANGFRFEVVLPDSPVLVTGDRDALAQVVVNLLSNAEKYSDRRKEISLRLETRATPLPHVEVRVLDRGLGVPRGSEEKIFEQFYRAHDSLSNGIQGSGLGLTLARQIARAHGGEVAFERRDGGGSSFTLRLPLAAAQ